MVKGVGVAVYFFKAEIILDFIYEHEFKSAEETRWG
jgi:hypothetical protein